MKTLRVPAVSLLGRHFVIGPDPIRPLIIRGHRLVPSECCCKTWRKNRCQGQATLEFDAAKLNKSKVERKSVPWFGALGFLLEVVPYKSYKEKLCF